MRHVGSLGLALCAFVACGCISKETHTRTLGQLESERNDKAALEARLADLKQRLAQVDDDRGVMREELLGTQTRLDGSNDAVARLQQSLYVERDAKRGLEERLEQMGVELHHAGQATASARRDRDQLQTRNDALKDELAETNHALDEAIARIETLQQANDGLTAAVTGARDRARDLQSKLDAEQAQVASLQEDNLRLLSGTSTAKDEIDRLQKRAGEPESASSRAADLEQRLVDRDQEIGHLRQTVSDRDTLAAKAADLAATLHDAQQRLTRLTDEAAELAEERDRLSQERQHLSSQLAQLRQDKNRLSQAEHALLSKLQQEQERLAAEAAEKVRLEQERVAKEEEIRRLTHAQDDLSQSFQDEIAKGHITIQRVRDRLTINMIDQVLFDSGRADIKPEGRTVLKRVSEVVAAMSDKQIRIEGHTDNVPIGPKIKERFASNWELSTARATSVVHYLLETGGINRQIISVAGYADTRPVAGNETDEGKASNRRIEIVLYPKDLKEIVEDLRADAQ
ncbi:hypothetical protein YTPLAS18_30950 [Nitrospira sp.]|nr:hypothetical protein YTPLAS18_30950 [Nitrospira sp.]